MLKKNLIILLLIPFLIALLGVITINTTFSFIDNDIIGIEWNYTEFEDFKVQDGLYPLTAQGINEKDYPAGAGNGLVWTVRNEDPTDTNVYAEIVKQGNQYYLKALGNGTVIITCSNEKGNVFKSMRAAVYTTGAIVVNNVNKASLNNIDPTFYLGQYDLIDNNKQLSEIDLNVKVVPSNFQESLYVAETSSNIEFDLATGHLKVTGHGEAYIKFSVGQDDIVNPYTYKFIIVEDGINVYSYSDLMYCTNDSEEGEKVVLQKSFESLQNAYKLDNNGEPILVDGHPVLKDESVLCFGNYDPITKNFLFDDETYKFDTKFNRNFIDQWNNEVIKKGGSNYVSTQLLAGLHVQKDFYGNGYTINLHNLAYPKQTSPEVDANGNTVRVPVKTDDDYFQGPLPFYALGDPTDMPIVAALGQDNVGMYVDGDNIIINDINIRNCDFGNMLTNLTYTGTVVETRGTNITISNSRLSNGKNVLRAFSTYNLKLDNSMLSNARNFLISIGSNEYYSTADLTGEFTFIDAEGKTINSTLSSYLQANATGDSLLNQYLVGSFKDKDKMKSAIKSIEDVMNFKHLTEYESGGSVTINDTLFYRSGVSSIGLESMFNGSFLYNSTPSMISMMIQLLTSSGGDFDLSFLEGNNIGGVMYPVDVVISGSTKFYDYKTESGMDISGLIEENISTLIQNLPFEYEGDIDVDKIFPIKNFLYSKAPKYSKDGNSYLNVPIAFYGGGVNLSTVTFKDFDDEANMTNNIEINLLDNYLQLAGIDLTDGNALNKLIEDVMNGNMSAVMPIIKGVLYKCVTVVIGYEPFEFVCYKNNGYLYGETPKVEELILNTKEN